MTVNTTNITSGPYIGNGLSDQYEYTFRVDDKTQLSVYETTDLGVQTLLVVDTDYTVAGIGVDGGGIITRVAGVLPTDYKWYIRSNYTETQLTAFASQGGFFPDTHEEAMDKLTFLIQQVRDTTDRTFRLSDSVDLDGDFFLASDAATRAGNYLGFDPAGDLVVSSGTGADAGLRTDLASTGAGAGASLVAVRDAATQFAAADVEGVLAEIGVEVDANTAAIAASSALIAQDLITATFTHEMASDADYTLSAAENLNGRIIITDSGVLLTTGRNIIVADTERTFFAQNDTAQTLTFKTLAGSGISILPGKTRTLLCDSTNVVQPHPDLVEATDAEVVTGTADDVFVSPANLLAFAKSITTNGYYTLPGGLIVQWGVGTVGATTTATISFPIAFPTAAFTVTVTYSGTGVARADALSAAIASTSSFNVRNTTSGASNVYWIAIGH